MQNGVPELLLLGIALASVVMSTRAIQAAATKYIYERVGVVPREKWHPVACVAASHMTMLWLSLLVLSLPVRGGSCVFAASVLLPVSVFGTCVGVAVLGATLAIKYHAQWNRVSRLFRAARVTDLIANVVLLSVWMAVLLAYGAGSAKAAVLVEHPAYPILLMLGVIAIAWAISRFGTRLLVGGAAVILLSGYAVARFDANTALQYCAAIGLGILLGTCVLSRRDPYFRASSVVKTIRNLAAIVLMWIGVILG